MFVRIDDASGKRNARTPFRVLAHRHHQTESLYQFQGENLHYVTMSAVEHCKSFFEISVGSLILIRPSQKVHLLPTEQDWEGRHTSRSVCLIARGQAPPIYDRRRVPI